MRAFIALAVTAFAAAVAAASDANAFNNPPGGYTFKTGEPTALSWKPSTPGTISLRLQWGGVSTPTSGTAIASNIPNSGSFTWNVPSSLPAEPDYTIEIIDDSNPSEYNFLPKFTVQGAGSMSSTSSAESTSASMTATSSTTSATSTTPTPTTMTSATSTTASSSSATTSSASSTTSSTSATAASTASSTPTTAPTTNAGVAHRVPGGVLAVIAGAIAVM